ncbi:MAG: OmcA/MtrC family decaheme c-type cytochrome [Bryobacteraceae bacterium]
MNRLRMLFVIILLGGLAALMSAPGSLWTQRDKAYYMDENQLNFVRPGLVTKIKSATVEQDGTMRVVFTITDPRGVPLDRDGIVTPGPVSTSFIAAMIPASGTQYVAYTTRTATSNLNGQRAVQASSDTGGRYDKVADGEYRYTFGTKAPSTIDRAATHSIGVYSTRNLSEFDMPNNTSDDVFNFVPAGGAVTKTRDIIKTATCNKCHDPLALHGGSRQKMELCVMCHSPQTSDPDTGNTVDMPVMIHKIHMGEELPSVQAGGKYQIIGNRDSVHDYSHVVFPPDVRKCETCHEKGATPETTPAQADAWMKPNRAACGACHDNVNFATGENHANLPQVTDNQCTNCHTPEGELEFDVSIRGAHTIERFSKTLPGTMFELVRVANGSAGEKPTLVFKVTDKQGKPIIPSEMTRLGLNLAGPTTDYKTVVSEDARQAQGSADGTYSWTFANALPADAKGTYAVEIEGYRNQTLLAGTQKERVVRDAGVSKVLYFSVDGSAIAPRRTVVSLEKCNACHGSLSLHGDNRNTIESCVMCHNPSATDAARRPAAQGPNESIDMRTMIHRIHSGAEQGRPYIIYGFGSNPIDFSHVEYPGDLRNCEGCHVNGSEQLPLRAGLDSVTDPRGPVATAGPTAAACGACHAGTAAASHAVANTTAVGESCSVCHGPNADFAVNRAHAR